MKQAYNHKAAELSLQQGCLLWGSRVVIPESLRSRVLWLLHAGYAGVEKTKMVALSRVPDQAIAHMVQSCYVCQEHQQASHHVEITAWPFPQRPWSCLHTDFGGPSEGHYFPMVVDAFSKWVEAPPVTLPSANASIAAMRPEATRRHRVRQWSRFCHSRVPGLADKEWMVMVLPDDGSTVLPCFKWCCRAGGADN